MSQRIVSQWPNCTSNFKVNPKLSFPGTLSMCSAIGKQFPFFTVQSRCKKLATWAFMKY